MILTVPLGTAYTDHLTRPGRGVRHGAEADHIIPFDHDHPELGGPTATWNLHLLCRRHHQMKTAGILRPTRMPEGKALSSNAANGIGIGPTATGPEATGPTATTSAGHADGTDGIDRADEDTERHGAWTGIEPGQTVWTFHPDPTGPAVHTITHRDEHELMTPATVHDLTRATHGPEANEVSDPDPPPRPPTSGARLPTKPSRRRSTAPRGEPPLPPADPFPSAFDDPPPF